MGKINHILLDLDDVLVDWRGGVAKLLGKPDLTDWTWDTSEGLGIPKEEMWQAIDDQGATFWANLEPTPWADELIQLVSQWPWSIATAYARDACCSYGKHLWCRANFGELFEGMCILKRKWLMAKPSHVLIDDRESNVFDFMNHGGFGIILPRTYNANKHFCDNRMEYIRECLERADRNG